MNANWLRLTISLAPTVFLILFAARSASGTIPFLSHEASGSGTARLNNAQAFSFDDSDATSDPLDTEMSFEAESNFHFPGSSTHAQMYAAGLSDYDLGGASSVNFFGHVRLSLGFTTIFGDDPALYFGGTASASVTSAFDVQVPSDVFGFFNRVTHINSPNSEYYDASCTTRLENLTTGEILLDDLQGSPIPGDWHGHDVRLDGIRGHIVRASYACTSSASVPAGVSDSSNFLRFTFEFRNDGDCNGNGEPDWVDAVVGFTDCNANGYLDVCDISERISLNCSESETLPCECDTNNRFLRHAVADPPVGMDETVAIRIKLIEVGPFPASNGISYWVALPAEITDGFSGETFYAARLQCTPHVQSWPNALLYLYGSEIVPNSIYETRYADAACLAIGDESCMSEPYYLHTGRWGDIIEPFASEQSTIQQPDFGDVSACVNKFKEQAGALSRTRVKLSGVVPDPNSQISFSDISHLVDAFRGGAYPYLGPTACP